MVFTWRWSKEYQFQENKGQGNQTNMANWNRKVCFLGKAEKLQEQGAKNGRTEKVPYRNVKEYQRVVYSKCRELATQLVKSNCATDRRLIKKSRPNCPKILGQKI